MEKKIMRKTAAILMAWIMVVALAGTGIGAPWQTVVSADSRVSFSGATSAIQGEVDVRISYTITGSLLSYDTAELDFGGDTEGLTIGSAEMSGDKSSGSFKLSVSKSAETGTRYYQLVLRSGGSEVYRSEEKSFQISEKLSTPSKDGGKSITAMDISHSIQPESGFLPGKGNTITFEVFNKGNMMIRDAQLMLTLPDGLSVYNDSNTLSLGYLSAGTRKTVSFTIFADEKVESKMYSVTVQLTGFNYSSGEGATKEKTFYIPVEGKNGKATLSVQDLAIRNVTIPSEARGINPFTLSFEVANQGTSTVKDVKVSLELPEKVLNRTVASFAENTMAAGAVRKYSVSLFAAPDAEKKNYPIKILVQTLGEDGSQIGQYAGIYVIPDDEGEEGGVKKPQLMVAQYSYSGSAVQAGTTFPLSLSLLNTSAKELRNIKVTLKEADGQIVPVGSSSSFFIESIDGNATYSKTMTFNVKPQAEQKTTTMSVSMTYEDRKGNEFTAEDTVSIPITQETRLVVDDIVPPYEVYAGQPGAADVQFYNMGKNTLSNVRVTAEGNFDVMESNSYFAGNMESGKSDSFTFSFIPREVGPMEGVVTFTYEDSVGAQQYIEVPFAFEVMEMPVWDETPPDPEGETKAIPWSLIIAGAVVVLLVVGFIIWRKVRRARLHKALEIEDMNWEKSMDLGEAVAETGSDHVFVAESTDGNEEIRDE